MSSLKKKLLKLNVNIDSTGVDDSLSDAPHLPSNDREHLMLLPAFKKDKN